MIKTFEQYARMRDRRLNEDDESSGVGPSLGADGRSAAQGQSPGGGDARAAFKDLVPSLENGLTGPTGPNVLSAIVNAIMGDSQVPERVKQEIRQKVQDRWSSIVDLNDSPVGQGPGLGNAPATSADPSMNNVVVPAQADMQGAR